MTEPETIEKFRQYKQRCEDETGISIDNQFPVSEAARKDNNGHSGGSFNWIKNKNRYRW